MRIVGFGTYDRTAHPRIGILLDGLRAHGDDVVEINAPLGFSTAQRVVMLRRPWLAYRLVVRLVARWVELARAARRARRNEPVDAVVVGYLGHFDVLLARAVFRRTPVVLDMLIFAADTARDRGVSGGMKLRLLDVLDRVAVRAADVVLVDTCEHVELLRPAARAKAVVVPVGAPAAWLAAGRERPSPHPAPLRVAFFGLFTPLQGAPTIGAALALLAGDDIDVTMIGNGQDLDRTRELAAGNARVHWLDWVDAAALPALVAGQDICLGIFGTTPKAARVVPNKVFQGAAAGCAVLTSDTQPQRRALGEAAVFVPAGDPAALAAALRDLAADPARTARLRDAARHLARTSFEPAAVTVALRDRLTAHG